MNKSFLMGCCLALLALAGAGARAAETAPDPPTALYTHALLRPADMRAVRWTQGFWADRHALCKNTIVPEMKKALLSPDNSACLVNFRIGAGLEKGPHQGTNWSDGDCYKWIEAMAWLYAIDPDPALDKEMDTWIDLIAKTQAPDGYISTQIQLDPARKRWDNLQNHELYNMGHLLTAAAAHTQATGKRNFLEVARKAAQYLYGVFSPRPRELAHMDFNPSQMMGLVDLYRATGEARWLELADVFVTMRGSVRVGPNLTRNYVHVPGDQTQDRTPLRQETQAVGHAVTGGYLYCGAADLAAETGDKALLAALERIWLDVTQRKMYITGANGAIRQGVSINNDPVHEAFGFAYELPHRIGYNETCANIANAMFSWRLLLLTAEARYADVM
ncbi:MAG: glycoside hydrolase family 127 protein, partial [Acidobacteria bacterium]|nr:glycoside hydrolase family 127 protein [Acidobacteriota bacterium]